MFRKIILTVALRLTKGDSDGNDVMIILHATMVLYVVSAKQAAFCTQNKYTLALINHKNSEARIDGNGSSMSSSRGHCLPYIIKHRGKTAHLLEHSRTELLTTRQSSTVSTDSHFLLNLL